MEACGRKEFRLEISAFIYKWSILIKVFNTKILCLPFAQNIFCKSSI